jgi:tRNA-dihydrouridine synthase B
MLSISSNAQPSPPRLRLGPYPVEVPSVLAPMTGVTDLPFRRIVARYGAGVVVSEMIASSQIVAGDEEARLKLEGDGLSLHVVQIAGCDAVWMARAAKLAEGAGADVIDINMGCPAKKVVGGMAGSALMRDVDHATSLVEAVVAAVRVPVTVKMRLGWDETSLNAPELARRVVEAGAVAITVHGRTRNQFYDGTADWQAVRAVRSAIDVPLVVNGDIVDGQTARLAMAQSGADGVMIGRQAIGRPWLVGQIGRHLVTGAAVRDPGPAEQGGVAIEHYESALSHYGVRLGMRMVRKHLAQYLETALGCSPDEATRLQILANDDPVSVTRSLAAFYSRLDERRAA